MRIDRVHAGALAAHYGSVSAVTFTASLAFLDRIGVAVEGFLPALVALLEAPAIIVGLWLARSGGGRRLPLGAALREVVLGPSILALLLGSLAGLASASVMTDTPSWLPLLFTVTLALFLFDIGLVVSARLRDSARMGGRLVAFAVLWPLVQGTLGAAVATWIGLSVGGATVFATMAASASYIAAPAAVRIALPEADPGKYLPPVLAVTFPFNLLVGIPVYLGVSRLLA